ncbi:MAG: histidine--tRNA ligase, partial [Candidatus Nealsonbacteria bacterium]
MSKKLKFQSPTGMHDILPPEQKYFQKIYEVSENIANFYQFQKIETPILEETELFSKGIGFSTDIVGKQMFSLRTKGGDYLTLRPEGTAPVVRAYIEHGMFNLPQPVKLWYFGPNFRYEKPQAGRYRQFWQFGFEVFGEESPVIDAQIIQIFYNILRELKLKNLIIDINSIGDNQCRPYYKKLLVSYFRSRESSLCADCRRRLRENPLRILDCQEEKCQRIISQAPQMIDHLCENCHSHFKEVLEFLDEIELPYHLNPYLVRGLDYYTKTVFEIYEESEEGRAQGALTGGGRYDALVKLLGGKDTSAVGASTGIERIIAAMKTKAIRLPQEPRPKIYLAQLGTLAKRKSLKLLEDFRAAKIQVSESFGRDSLKAQLARADKIEVKYTLILGQKEALEGTIIIRDMETGRQETIKTEKV